jgi:Leucine-rich repeat (LRR) protein
MNNIVIVLTDDKDFGVIPPVIFKLKSLQKLDLSFSAITVIPDGIKTLLKLQTLNLEHCLSKIKINNRSLE